MSVWSIKGQKVIHGDDGYTVLPEGGNIIASNINSKLTIPKSKEILKKNKETQNVTQKSVKKWIIIQVKMEKKKRK